MSIPYFDIKVWEDRTLGQRCSSDWAIRWTDKVGGMCSKGRGTTEDDDLHNSGP